MVSNFFNFNKDSKNQNQSESPDDTMSSTQNLLRVERGHNQERNKERSKPKRLEGLSYFENRPGMFYNLTADVDDEIIFQGSSLRSLADSINLEETANLPKNNISEQANLEEVSETSEASVDSEEQLQDEWGCLDYSEYMKEFNKKMNELPLNLQKYIKSQLNGIKSPRMNKKASKCLLKYGLLLKRQEPFNIIPIYVWGLKISHTLFYQFSKMCKHPYNKNLLDTLKIASLRSHL
ncbi:hypothetical protein HYPBUDRAFT_179273 [Hyphopichia burtonii NRRL Y-1933]|uniref:Uncharacterized protein n=1 Tax=Hyphopichia burtonii NRRL Y-1933 TaxID=984485 RepID=A0A1E4RSJ5_9ASCO|nr:hypothetical protein HYPBUDRAFT_179273 [Hyphopichia burtonii NRRL Y-1933]ODV70151.1 hypothetical protein HYPBUDRAFT_179273 [Hyphopichia burtonii NRRL Y-1933]